MMGKNHLLVSGSAMLSAVAIDGYAFKVIESTTDAFPQQLLAKHFFINYFYPSSVLQSGELIILLWSGLVFIGYLIGSLLPDIDSKSSILGRYFHLPIGHRTWTHTIWAIIILFVVSIFIIPFRPVLIGFIMHVIEDYPSGCGICLTYPFHKYIEYESGARVADGHKFKLYNTSDVSEKRFVFIILAVLLIIIWFCGIMGGGFASFWRVLTSVISY